MAAKFVKISSSLIGIFMTLFFINGVYSQSKEEVYFLVNAKDTLIKKQITNNRETFEGYLIIDEKRLKTLNKTPTKENEVWVPESDDDFHTLGPAFKFHRENDRKITNSEFNNIEVIRSRKEFLNKFFSTQNPSEIDYFFIEPIKCSTSYILRRVFPIFLE